tara:strand:- start:50 stop:526 length:477 start_codon:yes stop_codon:yes gene_type:complete
MGISITDVSTAADLAQVPLGFEYHEPADATNNYGERVWVYVEAGGALAAGEVCMREDAGITSKVVVTTGAIAAVRCLGVAQHAIASGSFGFILKRGLGEIAVVDGDADQANDPLVTAAGGRVDSTVDSGEEGNIVAFGTENAGSSAGDLLTAHINCLG